MVADKKLKIARA